MQGLSDQADLSDRTFKLLDDKAGRLRKLKVLIRLKFAATAADMHHAILLGFTAVTLSCTGIDSSIPCSRVTRELRGHLAWVQAERKRQASMLLESLKELCDVLEIKPDSMEQRSCISLMESAACVHTASLDKVTMQFWHARLEPRQQCLPCAPSADLIAMIGVAKARIAAAAHQPIQPGKPPYQETLQPTRQKPDRIAGSWLSSRLHQSHLSDHHPRHVPTCDRMEQVRGT